MKRLLCLLLCAGVLAGSGPPPAAAEWTLLRPSLRHQQAQHAKAAHSTPKHKTRKHKNKPHAPQKTHERQRAPASPRGEPPLRRGAAARHYNT